MADNSVSVQFSGSTLVLCSLLLGFVLSGCSQGSGSPYDEGGSGGEGGVSEESGGAAGTAGGGQGSAGEDTAGVGGRVVLPTCTNLDEWLGRNPAAVTSRITEGLSVTASEGVTNPEKLVDGYYHNAGGNRASVLGIPTEESQPWVAIELAEPNVDELLLVWTDPSWGAYDVMNAGAPLGYRIEISSDSTDGDDGTWTTVVEITDNPVRSRAHRFAFAGHSWVKLVATAAASSATGTAYSVKLDEISLYAVDALDEAQPLNTFLFMGDSITQGAFRKDFGDGTNFDEVLVELNPLAADPVWINAGIGGELARDGIAHLETWLEINPDFEYITLAYGTNDAWGGKDVTSQPWESDMRELIETILAEGRIPIVPLIPFASETTHRTLPAWNEHVLALTEEYGLPCGPDLYTWFRENPEELSDDGVHPSPDGYISINRLWAEAVLPLYPAVSH